MLSITPGTARKSWGKVLPKKGRKKDGGAGEVCLCVAAEIMLRETVS